MSRSRILVTAGLMAVIAAAVIAAYGNSLDNDFAFDEYLLITENYSLRDLGNLPRFFTSKFWPGRARGIYYRPMITASYALNYACGRESPLIYHATNIAFHVFNCLLLFALFKKLGFRGAFAGVLLFAVHPVHTESVAWISGRTDVIAVFFMLSAWLLWLGPREKEGLSRVACTGLSVLAFIAALLSKEIAVVFPLLVLLFHADDVKKRVPSFALLAVAAAAYFIVRHAVLSGSGPEPAPPFFEGQGLIIKVKVMALVWLEYARLLFMPYPLRVDYFYADAFSPAEISGPAAWLAACFLILLFAYALILWRRFPAFAKLVIACAVSLLPFSHIVSIPTLMAERFLYLASIFTCAGTALVAAYAFEKYRRAAASCIIATLVFFSAMTIERNRDWQDGFTFWRASLRQIPMLAEGHNLLGIFAMKRGMTETARHEYEAALRLDPGFSQARMNLSQLYYQIGDLDTAERLLLEAVEQNPWLSSAHYNLALVYNARGKVDLAKEELEEAVRLEPANLSAHYALANMLMKEKADPLKAEEHLMKCLGLDPGFLPAVIKLAESAASRGDASSAQEWIERGLEIDPGNPYLLRLLERMKNNR